MTLPGWRPRNVLDRLRRTKRRAFPTHTCSASRHAGLIAEALTAGRPYHMLTDEPQHCGVSIAVTVELLWKARMENARLKKLLAASTDTENSNNG